jgi:hypothetical protein
MKTGNYTSEQDRTALQFQGDGMLDIGLGLGLLIVGLAMYGDWAMSLIGIWVILWIFGVRAAKRKITLPRLALIDYSPSPEADRRRRYFKIIALVLTLFIFLVVLLLFVLGDRLPKPVQDWLRGNSSLMGGVISLLVVTLLGLAGWATGAHRLLVYAVLLVLGGIAVIRFSVELQLVLIALGGIFLVVGVILLFRFLQDFSLPAS